MPSWRILKGSRLKIKSIYIKNFRGIGEMNEPVSFADLNVFIGDNGTCKTAILEAINFCLSPGYAATRFNINDFHKGTERNAVITVEFSESFIAKLPDGRVMQNVKCNKIRLIAKKRDRAAAGKAFSDLVTTLHYVVPVAPRGESGWSQPRKSVEQPFEFTERQLSLSNVDVEIPRAFYFAKNRSRQLVRGYNSSLSNIIDDLNWRFEKGQGSKKEPEHFKHVRKELHNKVLGETDGDTLNKTVSSANEILSTLGVDPIDISLLKTLSPYDNSEIVFPFDGFELPVELAGSGIEMAVSLALLEAMAKISKGDIVVIIDEPGLHLHPKLQAKLFEHLKEMSNEIQVVMSTHSPILFKNIYREEDAQLLVTKKDTAGQLEIYDARAAGFGLLKWSPSWGEICYFAYDLPTIEFHDDLYSTIEDGLKSNPTDRIPQTVFENYILQKRPSMIKVKWTDSLRGPKEETIMTFVRNRIHHPDYTDRPRVAADQLKASIEAMLDIVKNP